MLVILVAVPTVMQNSLHPLSTSSFIAHHLLDFMVQGKIEADAPTVRLDATPSGLSVPLPPSITPTPFVHQMPFLKQPSQFILA